MAKDNIHATFVLAAEFREKIQRKKEDFGVAGNFFSCETLRGIYDFQVRDSQYFENESINPYDVILIRGRVCMRTDRIILEPVEFTVAETPELMKQAEPFIEYGRVSGDLLVCRKPYRDKVNDVDIPRVECKAFGFHDNIVSPDLFRSLPSDQSSVLMRYTARIALDVAYQRQEYGIGRRNNWVLSGQTVEPLNKPEQLRTVRREKQE